MELGPILAHYREHGYALVPQVASEEMLDRLRARADDIAQGRIVYPGMFFQADTTTGAYEDLEFGTGWRGPGESYRKIEKLEVDAIFREWLENPVFERIVHGIIPGDVTIYRALLMTKGARGGTVLPWHQDAGKFWGLDRDPELQIWTALDDSPQAAGCVEVFPGSHARGLVTPLGGLVNEAIARAAEAERHALAVPARAGDVLLIHNHLWHRSGVNTTPHTRRAFSVCYMSAETKCVRKKRAPRVFPRVFLKT